MYEGEGSREELESRAAAIKVLSIIITGSQASELRYQTCTDREAGGSLTAKLKVAETPSNRTELPSVLAPVCTTNPAPSPKSLEKYPSAGHGQGVSLLNT